MAKIKFNQPSGKIGGLIYRQTRNGLVVYAAPQRPATPIRSERQMRTRTQMANLASNCGLYVSRLGTLFEDKQVRHTNYNLFVQLNMNRCPVYLTMQQRAAQACVLAPYEFSHGSLMTIGYQLNEKGILVSNISLGRLVINKNTTVADFSEAIIRNNRDWEHGDELVFIHATQYIDPNNQMPYARMEVCRLLIDTTDQASAQPLFDQVSPLGFCSVTELVVAEPSRSIERSTKKAKKQYVLGMRKPLANAGAAWVHSRESSRSKTLVSTQRLHVVSDLLTDFQSESAFASAAESYGVIRTDIL